ncbi:MAG: hypothetical protein M3Y08_18080 [Fibrobacterota bacterium]|nr:hypothetical protein [Fibrobacterota bacterium]
MKTLLPKFAAGFALAAGLLSAEEPRNIRMNVALNPYPISDFADLSTAFTVSMKPAPRTLLSLRILGESETACEPCEDIIFRNEKRLNGMTEYSLLAGFVLDQGSLSLSGSAGPAYLFGKVKRYDGSGQQKYEKYREFGLALDARATYMFNRTIGVGIQGFGNVNPQQTIYGVMAALELRVW